MKRNSEELRGPAPEKRPMISGLKIKSADFYLPSRGYRILCKNEFLAKTSVSPGSSPLGTFREEERLRLSGRNSILMTQINDYIKIPVVMGFQIQFCPILRVFWSILVTWCVHLSTSSSKTQTLLLEKRILFHKYWLFCSRFFAFTFDLCGLLPFVCHS